MRKVGFGREEELENLYDRFIGKYVVLYLYGHQNTFSGRIDSIKDGHLILNPFTSGNWDSEEGLTRKLVYGDSLIRASDIVVIEPVSEQNIENYLQFQNKKN